MNTLNHTVLASNGDPICNVGYNIINSNFLLEHMRGHSTCGARDELYGYTAESRALTSLLAFERDLYGAGENQSLIGDFAVKGSQFYYVTHTQTAPGESTTDITEVIRLVDSSTRIDREIIDNIYIYENDFENNQEIKVFWATENGLYLSIDDGISGTEPWEITAVNASLLADLNKIPQLN